MMREYQTPPPKEIAPSRMRVTSLLYKRRKKPFLFFTGAAGGGGGGATGDEAGVVVLLRVVVVSGAGGDRGTSFASISDRNLGIGASLEAAVVVSVVGNFTGLESSMDAFFPSAYPLYNIPKLVSNMVCGQSIYSKYNNDVEVGHTLPMARAELAITGCHGRTAEAVTTGLEPKALTDRNEVRNMRASSGAFSARIAVESSWG